MAITTYNTLIFDLGDVLFTWTASPLTTVPPRTLHAMHKSATWHSYDRGQLSQDECYAALAQEFGFSIEEVGTAFQSARDSLKRGESMVNLIRKLKAASAGRKVYAMSNIPLPDFQVLQTKASGDDWAIFDRVFISAQVGERKPNLPFYEYVIQETSCEPGRTIFVDDKRENLETAEKVGWTGVQYDEFERVESALERLCEETQ